MFGIRAEIIRLHQTPASPWKTTIQIPNYVKHSAHQHPNAQDPLAKFCLNYPFPPPLFGIQIKSASCCMLTQRRVTRRRLKVLSGSRKRAAALRSALMQSAHTFTTNCCCSRRSARCKDHHWTDWSADWCIQITASWLVICIADRPASLQKHKTLAGISVWFIEKTSQCIWKQIKLTYK